LQGISSDLLAEVDETTFYYEGMVMKMKEISLILRKLQDNPDKLQNVRRSVMVNYAQNEADNGEVDSSKGGYFNWI